MFLPVVCCLLSLAQFSNGLVQFSQSTLYDIYDFQGVKEVALPTCNNGCLIFASTSGIAYLDPRITDAYMKNLVVHDSTTGKELSIHDIAKQVHVNGQKLPYLINAGRYSILNRNTDDTHASDVAVYVVDRATALSIDYEIYDASSIARASVAPKNVITVIGAKRFFVKVEKAPADNSFTARLVGFDNAQESNADDCTYAFKTQTFDGFEFHVDGPLISFVFDQKNPVTLAANYDWLTNRDLDKSGFLTSQGFHGCAKVNDLQAFRRFNEGFYGESFDLHSEPTNLRVVWDIDTNLTQNLAITDMTNGKRELITGVQKNVQITMVNTQFALVQNYDGKLPSRFIARYTSTPM